MESKNQKSQKRDVYQIVTDRIIRELQKGTVPWHKPWTETGLPQNLITKRPYRGINVWLLALLHYPRNFFLTDKQLKELGGTVKKDEKATPVIYWNWKDVIDEDSGEEKKVPFLRYYLVYNVDQCQGIPYESIPALPERSNNPIALCESVIEGMPQRPLIKFREQRAFYNPLLDFINMPKLKTFESSERYYETFFHEMTHSTGHLSRLNRKELMQMEEFGGDAYSIEELTAEMGACYLKSHCGLDYNGYDQNASYIQSWLSKLKDDKYFVIYAAAKAQRAADFILNAQPEGIITTVENETTANVENEVVSDDLPF
jgi:antirestriction protein ArdC